MTVFVTFATLLWKNLRCYKSQHEFAKSCFPRIGYVISGTKLGRSVEEIRLPCDRTFDVAFVTSMTECDQLVDAPCSFHRRPAKAYADVVRRDVPLTAWYPLCTSATVFTRSSCIVERFMFRRSGVKISLERSSIEEYVTPFMLP